MRTDVFGADSHAAPDAAADENVRSNDFSRSARATATKVATTNPPIFRAAILCLLALALLAGVRANASVGLLDFTATLQTDGSILVRWETSTELNTGSFEIFRAETAEPPWGGTPIHVEPARGDGVTGAVYTYLDRKSVV